MVGGLSCLSSTSPATTTGRSRGGPRLCLSGPTRIEREQIPAGKMDGGSCSQSNIQPQSGTEPTSSCMGDEASNHSTPTPVFKEVFVFQIANCFCMCRLRSSSSISNIVKTLYNFPYLNLLIDILAIRMM